jgi:peptidoglycan/LPS O-acetylase OafA/YrhL
MIRLGELSFSFYMVHLLVLAAVKTLLPSLITLNTIPGLGTVTAMFGVALGLSWVLYEFVETPGRRLIAGGWRRKVRTEPSPA